jgi:hypothetical protein
MCGTADVCVRTGAPGGWCVVDGAGGGAGGGVRGRALREHRLMERPVPGFPLDQPRTRCAVAKENAQQQLHLSPEQRNETFSIQAPVPRAGSTALMSPRGVWVVLLLAVSTATKVLINDGWTCNGAAITLPHTAGGLLGYQDWNASSWADTFHYQRTLEGLRSGHGAVQLLFEGILTSHTLSVNNHTFPPALGGYLPFTYDITPYIGADGVATLKVAVNGRFQQNVPPNRPDASPDSVDFLQPAGIYR